MGFFSGMLSSSEDECDDSYSSDGEEGNLIIDATSQAPSNDLHSRTLAIEAGAPFSNHSSESEHQ